MEHVISIERRVPKGKQFGRADYQEAKMAAEDCAYAFFGEVLGPDWGGSVNLEMWWDKKDGWNFCARLTLDSPQAASLTEVQAGMQYPSAPRMSGE